MGCSSSHFAHHKMKSYREYNSDVDTTSTLDTRGEPDGETCMTTADALDLDASTRKPSPKAICPTHLFITSNSTSKESSNNLDKGKKSSAQESNNWTTITETKKAWSTGDKNTGETSNGQN